MSRATWSSESGGLPVLGPPATFHPVTVVSQPAFITVEDFLAGDELSAVKHEYLGGIVHLMAGATIRHNNIAGNCFDSLYSQLHGKACQPHNSDTKVRIQYADHTRLYYPDAMVVSESNPDTQHFQDRPVVVVEVLSESTRRTDLAEKRDAYLTIPTLMVLVLVEPNSPSVTLHRRKPHGGFEIECHSGVDAILPFPEIDAALPLAELYERIAFAP